MASIFRKVSDISGNPSRNTFDGSFVNNLTTKFGQITPCFLKEVIPGDSFKIDSTFGFNLMPMTFPVQTRIRCDLHFFYVRNRALWKGWQDFITKTENRDGDSTPPYIMLTDENRDMVDTGKIGDYLGVPTVYYTDDNNLERSSATVKLIHEVENVGLRFIYGLLNAYTYRHIFDYLSGLDRQSPVELLPEAYRYCKWLASRTSPFYVPFCESASANGSVPVATLELPSNTSFYSFYTAELYDFCNNLRTFMGDTSENGKFAIFVTDIPHEKVLYDDSNIDNSQEDITSLIIVNSIDETVDIIKGGYIDTTGEESIQFSYYNNIVTHPRYLYVVPLNQFQSVCVQSPNDITLSTLSLQIGSNGMIENSARSLANLPYASTGNANGIRVSALPFRAVEACYNSFYRDIRNNPLIVDGKPLYNTYTENVNGGADTTHYKLYQRNWQDDYLTTAVQSPQQGAAPLVGVTASGQMTFQDENGQTFYLQAEFGEDGETITGIKSYSSDMPVGTLRAMVDTISTGISINDFRNVNALQRWLERNMRKGLRYKDQLEAHFGVSPTYSELDIPEFIGGMSRDVDMNRVVQSSETSTTPLGTLAGNGTVLGQGGQAVSKFCDEHGWIIGFVTFSPVPVYSQQLNKQLLKTELLDYYFPEFAHIGFQPILNKEVAPLQAVDNEELNSVFGYQRAWYEYLESVDEVHGDFRTSLRDYIISRKFDSVPQLGEDFLTISKDDANNVFAVDDDTDKIFGQIYFDCKMKRPIPEYGIPKLEVE